MVCCPKNVMSVNWQPAVCQPDILTPFVLIGPSRRGSLTNLLYQHSFFSYGLFGLDIDMYNRMRPMLKYMWSNK